LNKVVSFEIRRCDEAMAGGNVANPLQIPTSARNGKGEDVNAVVGSVKEKCMNKITGVCKIVVDEDWLALRDSQGEADI
jgi:hypothetical protein